MRRRSLLLGTIALPLSGCSWLQQVFGVLSLVVPKSSFVVVWQDEQDWRVRARGFKPSGSSELFSTFIIHQTGSATSQQRVPAIAANKDGFVVTWVETGTWGVVVKGFNLDGSMRFSAQYVEQNVPWDQAPGTGGGPWYAPRVAMATDGSFVVCWDRGSGHPPRVRKYMADGTPSFMVDVAPPSARCSDVAIADDGTFAVTWSETHSFIRGFNPNGSIKFGGTPIRLSESLSNFEQGIAMTPDGSRIVVVQGCWQDPDHQELVLAHGFSGNGTRSFAGVEVPSTRRISQKRSYPTVAIDNVGRFFATWQEDRDGNNNFNVRGRIFEADGSATGPDIVINADASGQQLYPAIATNRSGEYILAWQDDRDNNGVYQIHARGLFGDKTEYMPDKTINTVATGQQRVPRVAMVPHSQ